MSSSSDEWGLTGPPSAPRAAVTSLFHHHYRRLVGLAGLMVDDRETAEEVAAGRVGGALPQLGPAA
jgi:hypothetical protein